MVKRIIVSGPRGAGKGTFVVAALDEYPALVRMVSCTSRPPREGEMNGIHYHFVTRERIEEMHARGELFWMATIGNHVYGLPKSEAIEKPFGIIDVHPFGARYIRRWAYTRGESTFLIAITASRSDRTNRLMRREKGLSLEGALRLLREDPINSGQKFRGFNVIFDNSDLCDMDWAGWEKVAFRKVLDKVGTFLRGK